MTIIQAVLTTDLFIADDTPTEITAKVFPRQNRPIDNVNMQFGFDQKSKSWTI